MQEPCPAGFFARGRTRPRSSRFATGFLVGVPRAGLSLTPRLWSSFRERLVNAGTIGNLFTRFEAALMERDFAATAARSLKRRLFRLRVSATVTVK